MNYRSTAYLGSVLLCLSLLLGACAILSPPLRTPAVTVIVPLTPFPPTRVAPTPIAIASFPTPVRILPAATVASTTPSLGSSPVVTTPNCDQAAFIADVTAPLGTVFSPGEVFTKTWRIKNAGACYWSAGYSLVLVGGPQMGNTTSIGLPSNIPPGSIVDISINLTAPSIRKYYQSFWKLRDPQGNIFGCGEQSENPLLVQIEVAGLAPSWSSHKDYGFAFDHPTSWNFREEQHYIYLSEGNRTLVIGYKLIEENVVFSGNIGYLEEELQTRATVPFLGKIIRRQVLLNEKRKVKAVFYNNDRGDPEIRVGGKDPLTGVAHPSLVFYFEVQDPADYAATNIPESFRDALDSILASFRWYDG